MAKIFNTDNEDLKPFFDEINRYSEGVNKLNNGVSAISIGKFEDEANIKLPQIYKDFLMVANGGFLATGTSLVMLHEDSDGDMVNGIGYLNQSLNSGIRWQGMPSSYLIIADMSFGDNICIDLESSNGYDAEIVQWDHESNCVSRRWTGLIDWLLEEAEEITTIFDYDGNELD